MFKYLESNKDMFLRTDNRHDQISHYAKSKQRKTQHRPQVATA